MNSNLRALVNRRLAQADETLQVAHEVLASGHYRDAINRAYYAMFYAGWLRGCSRKGFLLMF